MFKKILEELAEIKQILQQILQYIQDRPELTDDKKIIDDAFKLKNGLYSFKKQKQRIREG